MKRMYLLGVVGAAVAAGAVLGFWVSVPAEAQQGPLHKNILECMSDTSNTLGYVECQEAVELARSTYEVNRADASEARDIFVDACRIKWPITYQYCSYVFSAALKNHGVPDIPSPAPQDLPATLDGLVVCLEDAIADFRAITAEEMTAEGFDTLANIMIASAELDYQMEKCKIGN